MVRQPTLRSQQHKLQQNIPNTFLSSGNSLVALPSPDVSPSARNYESLHAMAKSGYLLALAQRSSFDFIFKALLGMIENCTSDFQDSQLLSNKREQNCALLQQKLDDKNSELSQQQCELLSVQQKLQISQNHELFYREQAQLFGACTSVRRREFARTNESGPQLMLRNSELTAVLDHQQTKLCMLQAENLCLNTALDTLIASSISQSADSVLMLEQTMLLSCAHQTIRNNILVCELENIRLADATDGSAPPHISVPLPAGEHCAILSREDLQALFSEVRDKDEAEICSTSSSDNPLSSAVLATLADGIAERWHWSYAECELLSKIHAGRNGALGDSFDEFERWYYFDYGSVAGHIPGRIPRSPSALVFPPTKPAVVSPTTPAAPAMVFPPSLRRVPVV